MTPLLYLLFVLSGAAGLIYESIWTRYLGLFVGHDAYAQIIVLVIFLGGMSAGAAWAGRRVERIQGPLFAYAMVEFIVGVIGLFFHDVYLGATAFAYRSIFPAMAGSASLALAKWSLAALLILPQSVMLGMTFPLMSAGVLRATKDKPGHVLSLLYFANSLGAAVGVLFAGFYLVHLAGLPGTLAVAAILNLFVAAATIAVGVKLRNQAIDEAARAGTPAMPPAPAAAPGMADLGRYRLLIGVTFGTAIASFIYEIDWIRMLSLVLGSATHSFELMLSAFILGLALGALWIRSRADRLTDPVRTLGIVQWVMGFFALATLPLYVASFDWMGTLLATFARTDPGYTGFNLARYGICLLVMVPATFCAGMTLPLITRTLMSAGAGERAIGAVYAWNTLGSIVGVVIGGLVLLPTIGLKAMLVAGGAIDMAIGAVLLLRSQRGRWLGYAALAGTAAVAVLVLGGVSLDQRMLVSGVYRTGTIAPAATREIKYYADGRTSTIAAVRALPGNDRFLSTNGKPEASLGMVWYRPCDSVTTRVPLAGDAATQALISMITLAYAPKAQTAAMIGHGSGMSTHFMLGSPTLKELATIEIEPKMIEGARAFYPANARSFDDPRSHHIIADAKSYFAAQHRKYDIILSEPSNPWVSGVSGLFTTEFYGRVRHYLSDDGVFGQWLQMYELDDQLVLSVLAAIHQNFASYQIFLLSGGDLLVVGSNQPQLPVPDWSVVQAPGLQKDLCRFRPLTPATFEALRLADRRALAPLVGAYPQPNSDFYPVLDLGAEKRRYLRSHARGFFGLSADRLNIVATLAGTPDPGTSEPVASLPENPRVSAQALGARLRDASTAGWTDSDRVSLAYYNLGLFERGIQEDRPPLDWKLWMQQMAQTERDLFGGTAGAGSADSAFYRRAWAYLQRHHAPLEARLAFQFRQGLALWDFPLAARAADSALPLVMQQHAWLSPDELREGAVVAKLRTGDVAGARRFLDTLAAASARTPGDLRVSLLDAYVRSAEREQRGQVGMR